MSKPYDTRLVAIVAQDAFEYEFNKFCTLVPYLYIDGEVPKPEDFPNEGELWWMLTAQTMGLAQPGHFVSCKVENAFKYEQSEHQSSKYQALRESVRELNFREDGLEILTIPPDTIDNLQALVSREVSLNLSHRPTPTVLLRWRDSVYGPFSITKHQSITQNEYALSFLPSDQDMTIYQFDGKQFQKPEIRALLRIHDTTFSTTTNRRKFGVGVISESTELLLGLGYQRLLTLNPTKILLEPISRKLMRFAKQCLTRTKRQQLKQLLEDLELRAGETKNAIDFVEVVQNFKKETEAQTAALDEAAKALLESGILGEDRLKAAEAEYAKRYVEQRTAELQARIEEDLQVKRLELRTLDTDLKGVESKLREEKQLGQQRIAQELELESEKARQEIEVERQDLAKQKDELARQQTLLKKNLEAVTNELRDAGDDVVNRFLSIAPLLKSTGVSAVAGVSDSQIQSKQDAKVKTHASSAFDMPAYIKVGAGDSNEPLSEKDFFARFVRLVADRGFSYRPLDLERFHLSIKCGDLTILGGPSGAGKSSLPSLYSEAILGRQFDHKRPRCSMISVSPSWLDSRDLLGHLNPVDRKFYPANSGLFQQLVIAAEEYGARRESSGLYFACLDEMNLSQVEHYFSEFVTLLGKDEGTRIIHFFSRQSVDEECPFKHWSEIVLSPSIRFIGTVNFDETTRLLSDRLLDRANLIRLTTTNLPASSLVRREQSQVDGRMVTLADFNAWSNDAALPQEFAMLFDRMRPLFSQLGVSVSARVYKAMCKFVGSCQSILKVPMAFDVQIAQRILPRVRNLMTEKQLGALDGLVQIMEQCGICSFEESMAILQEVRERASSRGWDLEE